ncbi:hypothetical protein [Defluviimonas sp. WL0075]|uniref:Adenylosuccinate lyase n=1 Tax=Albidovulum sediminicola TaxID=2984331 RepID=A0ABT2Z3J1_9RHOB|nr:hypothetical protein [Defluviimonas sp. WL0075]MCV2865351.1 hypothetical protein [Defluviimonas sp. WL0075]
MKTKAILAVFALFAAMSPALAVAEGCSHDQRSAEISCAEGSTWDAATQRCIVISS